MPPSLIDLVSVKVMDEPVGFEKHQLVIQEFRKHTDRNLQSTPLFHKEIPKDVNM